MTPFQSEWLQPVQDELNKQLHGVTKRWNAAVAVMNAELAKEYGMIDQVLVKAQKIEK